MFVGLNNLIGVTYRYRDPQRKEMWQTARTGMGRQRRCFTYRTRHQIVNHSQVHRWILYSEEKGEELEGKSGTRHPAWLPVAVTQQLARNQKENDVVKWYTAESKIKETAKYDTRASFASFGLITSIKRK